MDVSLSDAVMAVVILLLVATLSAIIFKRIKIPYTIGLVFVGIGLSMLCQRVEALHELRSVGLSHDLIMYVLLPALIFSAAINIDVKVLLKNLTPTLTLAAPGLVISTIITGLIVLWTTPLDVGGAMLFGALISATDPVAVISLFEIVGAPKRLRILVDGESLFNDATAIVMFNIVRGLLVSGAAFGLSSLFSGGIDFTLIFLGGLAVGGIIGYIMCRVIMFADNDPMIEVSLSTIVAYTAFIVADKYCNVSGVMAALGAGMVINYYGAVRFTPQIKQYMQQFWDFMAFVANSFIFLLLGFTEDLYLIGAEHYSGLLRHILWAIIAIQVARMVVVFGLCPLLNLYGREKINLKYQLVMFWGGLRGAVPLALVFSLPPDFPHRMLIIEVTLGVVIFTLFVQGTTIKALLSVFKLNEPDSFTRFEAMRAMCAARLKGLKQLSKLKKTGYLSAEKIAEFEKEYSKKVECQEKEFTHLADKEKIVGNSITRTAWSRVLLRERDTFQYLLQSGFISENIYRKLDFFVEQLFDSIVRDARPPSHFSGEPTAMRIESLFFRAFSRFVFSQKLRSRYQTIAITDDYLTLCCLAIGAHEAHQEIKAMKQSTFFASHESVIEECRNFFSRVEQNTMAKLGRLKESNPELLETISRATLQLMIYSTEAKVINNMSKKGEIPGPVSHQLITNIIEQISATRRKIYDHANN